MTDVKTQELGYNEWQELLEPYGWFPDAPRIEFGGRYMHLMGDAEPRRVAEAELRFTVRPRT